MPHRLAGRSLSTVLGLNGFRASRRRKPLSEAHDSLERIPQPQNPTCNPIKAQKGKKRAARNSETRPGGHSASKGGACHPEETHSGSAHPPSEAGLLPLATSDVRGQMIPCGGTVLCTGLSSPDANSTPHPVVTTKSVYRLCQRFPGG